MSCLICSRRAVPGLLLCASLLAAQRPEQILNEADRLAWLRNWTAAEPFFRRAELQFAAQGDERNRLYAEIGRLRGELPHRGLFETSQLLAGFLKNPTIKNDLGLRLRCLTVKGDVDLDMDTNLAERDWTEALAVARGLKDEAWINRANGELGVISYLHGDSRTATVKVLGALAEAKRLKDVSSEIRYATLIGDALIELQRYAKGMQMLDDALMLARNTPQVGDAMLTYAGEARALVAVKRISEAEALLQSELQAARDDRAYGYESLALQDLATLEIDLGKQDEAVEHLRESTLAAERVDGHDLIAQAQLQLSRILQARGELVNANRAAVISLGQSRIIGDKFLVPLALGQLAAIEQARRRYRRAEQLYEEADEIVNAVLAHAPSANSRKDLVNSMDALYLSHFRLEADFLNEPANALRVIEEARGRSIADSLRSRGISEHSSASLTEDENQISRLQLRLLKTTSVSDRQRILQRIFEFEQEEGRVEAIQNLPWLQHQTHPLPLSAIEKALHDDTAILEYVLTEPASYCIVIDRARSTIVRLPGRPQIEKQVERALESLNSEAKSVSTSALYDSLIAPVSDLISTKTRIVIVPDDVLHRLPFEMLGRASDDFILRNHIVSYAPSATVLTLLAEEHRDWASMPALAVATGIDTDVEKRRQSLLATRGDVNRGIFDIDPSKLPPLLAANDEARMVARVLGRGSQTLVGDKATESALKKERLTEFEVLHFAVHGLVSTKFPDRSALVLHPDPANGEDGFWQAREIARTKLNAELVTLSACDVASGEIAGEDGVANLVRPFLLAGVRSVVANLWPTNDDFSFGLMTEFYERLAQGMDKGRALQQAKLEMIRRYGEKLSPRLWAGFVLVGGDQRSLTAK